MSDRIDLYEGKYTLIDELSEGGGFRALRYGEEWRDLAGDKIVYAMFCEIQRLQKNLYDVKGVLAEEVERRLNGD